MVNIGSRFSSGAGRPTTVASPTRRVRSGLRKAEAAAIIHVVFDDDVKVRYPPEERLPRHAPAAFRVVPASPAVVTWVDPDDERMTTVSEAVKVNPEQRMLIDGKLVEADSGKTFDNVNPATEEVIGQVADASTAEMQRAIDAARRAFDETDWSTNHAFRKRCLEQLHEALQAEQEELREQLILEVGCPRMTTNGPQLDAPLSDALRLAGQADRRVRVGDGAARRHQHAGLARLAADLARARRRGRAPSCRGTSRSR